MLWWCKAVEEFYATVLPPVVTFVVMLLYLLYHTDYGILVTIIREIYQELSKLFVKIMFMTGDHTEPNSHSVLSVNSLTDMMQMYFFHRWMNMSDIFKGMNEKCANEWIKWLLYKWPIIFMLTMHVCYVVHVCIYMSVCVCVIASWCTHEICSIILTAITPNLTSWSLEVTKWSNSFFSFLSFF